LADADADADADPADAATLSLIEGSTVVEVGSMME
jgi:hypothetical protein